MPPAVVAIGAAVVGSAAGAAVAAAVGGGLLGAVLGALTATAIGIGAQLIFGQDSAEVQSSGTSNTGRTQMVIEPITTHKYIYGRVRVGGTVVFALTTVRDTGVPESEQTLDYLHLVIVHCAHEVDAFEEYYLGDEAVGPLDANGEAQDGSPFYSGGESYVRIHSYTGTASQTADADLVSESEGQWTSAHRLRGRAYTYIRLRYSEALYPSGIPNVSALIRGKKLYDPRTETTAWSDNAALGILDYIRGAHGLGAPDNEIDWDRMIAAANACDEEVEALDEATEARYTINGQIDVADRPGTILETMLSACAGRVVFTGGTWRLYPGVWTTPFLTLDESGLRNNVTYRPYRSRRDLFNTVRGVFASPDDNYQTTDYPPVYVSSYVSADGGEIAKSLDLPFTTSHTMAQRIARISLELNRRQGAIVYPANLIGMRVAGGDTVEVSLGRFNLVDVPYRVVGWKLNADMSVDISLDADAPEVYTNYASDLRELP